MPTTFYNVTLNGVTDFQDVDGNTYSWGSNGWLGFFNNYLGNGDEFDATYNLSGTDWTLEYFHTGSSGGGIFRINETTSQPDRFIRHMTLGEQSEVDLDTTRVNVIDGFGGVASHDIKLGSAGAQLINAFADTNRVETGSGFVSAISTGGVDTVVINGGANSINTGGQRDVVRLLGGFTGQLEAGDGNDLLVVNGGGAGRMQMGNGADTARLFGNWTDLLQMGNGNDTVIANGGGAYTVILDRGADKVFVRGGSQLVNVEGRGNNTVTVEANSRIDDLFLRDGTQSIDVQGNGRVREFSADDSVVTLSTGSEQINLINTWRSDTTLSIGSGGAGSIELYSDKAQSHTVFSSGWVRGIEMGDGQKMNLVMQNNGGGRVSLGNLADKVVVRNGAGVDAVNTQQGNDIVRIVNGGWIESLNVRQGADKIFVQNGGANAIRLDKGNDSLTVTGDSFVRSVDGSGGSKTIVASGNGSISTLTLSDGTSDIEVQGADARIRAIKLYENDSTIFTQGFHEMIYSWRGAQDIKVGKDGGVAAMTFFSDFDVVQNIEVVGWTGAIRADDFVRSNILVRGEVETINLGGENDRVNILGGSVEYITTKGGNDTILGGGSSDTVRAGAGNDFVRGRNGSDEIFGNGGQDRLNGDAGQDTIFGGSGNDIVRGQGGNDQIFGNGGRDRLNGDSGQDTIFGGNGNDLINGGTANDVLVGDRGADQFIFGKNAARDWVADFQDGIDLIKFTDQSGGFGSLNISNFRGDVRIIHDNGVIFLEDLAGTKLSADDFIFA